MKQTKSSVCGSILIILGPPGSGKGTQAKFLAANCDIPHVSPGGLLRELDNKYDSQSASVRGELLKMRKGSMVKHSLVYSLMFPKILEAIKKRRGIIIDGAIRDISQARGYISFFRKNKLLDEVRVVWIDVPKSELMMRIRVRKRRDDLTKDVIAMRFKIQGKTAQKPVLSYLRKYIPVCIVDGSGSVNAVHKRIVKKIWK